MSRRETKDTPKVDDSIEQIKSKVRVKSLELKAIEDIIKQKSSEIEAMDDNASIFMERIKLQEEEIERNDNAINEKRQILSNISLEEKSLIKDVAILGKKLSTINKDISKLEDYKVSHSQKINKDMCFLMDKYTKESNLAKEEISALKEEINALKSTVNENLKNLESSNSYIELAETKISNMDYSISEKQKTLDILEESKSSNTIIVETLDEEIKEKSGEYFKMTKDIKKLNADMKQIKSELESNKSHNLSLIKKEEVLNAHKTRLIALYKKAGIEINI